MQMIGVIGTGFMGSSLATAIRTRHPELPIGIVEKDEARRTAALERLNATDYTGRPGALFSDADIVVVAIKPQDLDTLADVVGSRAGGTTLISVLAGTTTGRIATAFPGAEVVRIMPNLAAEIGRAVIGISFPPDMDEAARRVIRELLSGAGSLVEVPEHLISTVTGLSGSGIAFVFEFIDALAMGAVAEGLPYAKALPAAIDVVSSAAEVLMHQGVHPQEMVSRVCSPAGTTIAGIRALHEGGFRSAVMDAVERAADRSRELES